MSSISRAFFPLWLDLENEPVLIIGAGRVASRRVASLIPFKPNLHVIASNVLPDFHRWQNEEVLKLTQRYYEEDDLEGQRLVFACTDDPDLNHRIVMASRERGIWAEGCTPGSGGTMYPGSLIRRGGFTLAISSSGTFPLLTRVLRECLEDLFGSEWEDLFEEIMASRSDFNLSDSSRGADWEARIRGLFNVSIKRYLEQIRSTRET